MISHCSRLWCGKSLFMALYLSQASKRDLLSFCLNPLIWALSITVLLGGKYRAKKTFFNSFHAVTKLDDRDWSQDLTLSLNENGKRLSLITSWLTPFAFTEFAYCTNIDNCKFGSSVGHPKNWFYWMADNNEGFNSKSFWLIAGAIILLSGSSCDGTA